MSSLRILDEDDVRAALDPRSAVEIARRTLIDQAEGRVMLSSPSSMNLDATPLGGPQFKFKAASVAHAQASGIRLIARNARPGGAQPANYCAVLDHDTGALTGLVPDFRLSRIRTAAFGAAVAERLVAPGRLVVALFGTGAIAGEIVPMLQQLLPMAELRIHSRRPESMAAFVAAIPPQPGLAVRAEPDRARMAPGADLVITLTESRTPLVQPGELQAGAVLCSMGSHNEVDHGVLLDAQRLIVDDVDYASDMGDGGAWIRQGHMSREAFRHRVDASACEVVAGRRPARLGAEDRVVALLQGMAIGDIAFAAHALRHSAQCGRGRLIDLP